MATFISFANQKGGVGKSQSTILLATALSNPPFNMKVLVSDIDKQQSISRLRLLDEQGYNGVTDTKGNPIIAPYTVVSQTAKAFIENAASYDDDFDVVFADIAGKLDNDLPPELQEITPILMVMDWCIVPVTGGNHNVNASSEFLHFATKVVQHRSASLRPLSVAAFANMEKSKTQTEDLNNELNAMSQQMRSVHFLQNGLKDYHALSVADTFVSQYKPNGKAAAALKFAAWVNEIVEVCELNDND